MNRRLPNIRAGKRALWHVRTHVVAILFNATDLGALLVSPTSRWLVEDDPSRKKCAKEHSEGINWSGLASPFHAAPFPDSRQA